MLAQNFAEREWIWGDRNAINFVIGSHDAHGMSFAKRGLERLQHHRAQFTFSDVHGGGVRATFRRTMPCKVFRLSDHAMVRVKVCSLRSAYISQAELSGEIRILAKVFFDAPPTRPTRPA